MKFRLKICLKDKAKESRTFNLLLESTVGAENILKYTLPWLQALEDNSDLMVKENTFTHGEIFCGSQLLFCPPYEEVKIKAQKNIASPFRRFHCHTVFCTGRQT